MASPGHSGALHTWPDVANSHSFCPKNPVRRVFFKNNGSNGVSADAVRGLSVGRNSVYHNTETLENGVYSFALFGLEFSIIVLAVRCFYTHFRG